MFIVGGVIVVEGNQEQLAPLMGGGGYRCCLPNVPRNGHWMRQIRIFAD